MRYPMYVISKGRPKCITARELDMLGVPFYLVVEPQELELYKEFHPHAEYLVTPFSNLGQGSIPVRNFVWDHSVENGGEAHYRGEDGERCEMLEYDNAWEGKLRKYEELEIGEKFVHIGFFDINDVGDTVSFSEGFLYEKKTEKTATCEGLYKSDADITKFHENLEHRNVMPVSTIEERKHLSGYMFDTGDGTWEYTVEFTEIPSGAEFFEVSGISQIKK
jgi:hypothetical protein